MTFRACKARGKIHSHCHACRVSGKVLLCQSRLLTTVQFNRLALSFRQRPSVHETSVSRYKLHKKQ